MKHTLLTIMLLASCVAQAQYVVDKGNESKAIDADRIVEATYVGTHAGQTLWMEPIRKGWQLLGADHQMALTRAQSLRTDAAEMLAATHHGDTVVALLADRSRKNRTSVLRVSCGAVGDWTVDTIDVFAHEKKDEVLLWAAVSPSGNRMGMCSIVKYHEKRQYSAYMTMLDADGQRLWRREFALGTMDQVYVTDDGRMVTLGTEQEEQLLHIIVNFGDNWHCEANEAVVNCEQPREFKIVNVIGSRMLALGTISGSGFRGAEKLCGGVIAMSYDVDSASVTAFSIRPFMNEDVNILYNKATKKVTHDQMVEHASPVAYAATPYGGAIVVGRNYEVVTMSDNGTEQHSFVRVGLHIVAADKDGKILWVRNLRRNDFQKKTPDMLNVGLAAMGENLCLIKSESRKYPTEYDIAKEAKQLTMGDKNNLVLYTITPDGEVKKDILEAKTGHTFLHLTPDFDIITVRGSRLRDIKLSRQ